MKNPGGLSEEERALIEDYVLGELSPDAMPGLEQRMQENPALRQELESLQATARLMPLGLPLVEPPVGLRDRILAANAVRQQVLSSEFVSPPSVAGNDPTPGMTTQRRLPWGKGLAAIATGLALVLAIDNVRLRRALNFAQQENIGGVASIMQRPNSRLIALQGQADSAAAGTLLFTPGQWQQVIVSLGDLPPLPPEEIYRMWLTLENGQIIFCGEFNTDAQGNVFVELRPAEAVPQGVKAQGVFVTVDTKSSPPEPSGDRILSGDI